MKRRQRSGRELRLSEHSRENSLSFPSLPSSPRNFRSVKPETATSQIYGTQNSIFEILLPIEPRELEGDRNRDVCSGDTSDNDSDIDKKYPKNQFHVCKFCGIKEESCECIGCGDVDDSGICKSNDDLRWLGAGENVQNDHIKQIELVNDNSKQEVFVTEITTQCELTKDSGDSEIDETNSTVNVITYFTKELQSTTADVDIFFDDSRTELDTIESESRIFDIFSTNDESLVEEKAMETHEETGQESSDYAEGQTAEAEVDGSQDTVTHASSEDVLEERISAFSPGNLDPTPEGDETEPEEDGTVPEIDERAPEDDEPFIPDEPPVYNLDETTESPQTSSELVSATIGDTGSSHAGTSKKNDMEIQEEEEEDEGIFLSPEGDHHRESTISQIPLMNPEVLAELLQADEESARTAALIGQMKDAIREYQEKDHLSEEDSLVLNIKQAELMKKLAEFEEITQRVQILIGIADDTGILPDLLPAVGEDELVESESALDSIPELDECRCKEEDIAQFLTVEESIPKVIVCGAENRVPRIIVCEPVKKNQAPSCKCPTEKEVPELMLSLTGRLSESYSMQERLASENAELEGGRYHLQEELLQKDNTVDALQRKVGSLQSEMRIIAKENSILTEKLAKISDMNPPSCCGAKMASQQSAQSTQQSQAPQGCACSDNRLEQYSNTTALLERQLNQIEGEVRGMQNELIQVQRERQQLEQQRKSLNGSSAPPGQAGGPCCPTPCPPCCPMGKGQKDSPELQLKELKEQYARLQEDYKSKLTEVSTLRRDNDKMKEELDKSKDQKEIAEAQCRCIQGQLRSAELDNKKMVGSKEQMMEQEQQLSVAKQRFREAQDELDELRSLVQDQSSQLEDYRNKYLQAQQQVEEQRRQIDVMEMDNSRISDQVNLEIQRVKNQFQEKLSELTPLPDILKATQLKLQEAQNMRACAERNLEELARELQDAKDKAMAAIKELEDLRIEMESGDDGKDAMLAKLAAWEKKCNELKEENSKIRTEMARLEEVAAQTERRLEEKLHEVAQLSSQLETVREESARQVARTKDRAETVRRSLQSQISDLERQLAQSRAAARSAQKDRDDIRQRMQCQINNLNENFDQAQLRIRSLQSHVNFLKTSYTNIFDNNMIGDAGSQSNMGFDTCDCNF